MKRGKMEIVVSDPQKEGFQNPLPRVKTRMERIQLPQKYFRDGDHLFLSLQSQSISLQRNIPTEIDTCFKKGTQNSLLKAEVINKKKYIEIFSRKYLFLSVSSKSMTTIYASPARLLAFQGQEQGAVYVNILSI